MSTEKALAVTPAVPAKRKRLAKKPKRKTGLRHGSNKGLTKDEAPALLNRLPREKRRANTECDNDGLTPFERALVVLGPRVKETKVCYLLDGKPCNATDLMRIAGVEVP